MEEERGFDSSLVRVAAKLRKYDMCRIYGIATLGGPLVVEHTPACDRNRTTEETPIVGGGFEKN